MKTVYTLTAEQFKELRTAHAELARMFPPSHSLGIVTDHVVSIGRALKHAEPVQQVEPRDRQGWQGDERRRFFERRIGDDGPGLAQRLAIRRTADLRLKAGK